MRPTEVTVRILTEIRDSVRDVRAELLETRTTLSARIDETNARLDETNVRLDTLANRVTESEIRTATAITGLGGTLEEVKKLLRDGSMSVGW